ESVELAELKSLVGSADREARIRAAAILARAVYGRDVHGGTHSHRVSDLAARLAERLDLSHEQVELIRVAGNLHDLGKLAVPDGILRQPRPLWSGERLGARRHP